MTTQQLECFIRVADKLNFTKAAQEMFDKRYYSKTILGNI